jgi:hypothetical protein
MSSAGLPEQSTAISVVRGQSVSDIYLRPGKILSTYAIVSKGKTIHAPSQVQHIGIMVALAAWRATQGIYRFDPTTFDALWKTPVAGDIPT